MGMGLVIHDNASEELLQAVRNDNIDRINDVIESLDKDERKSLVNMRDSTNREPFLNIAIRKKNLQAFNALADAGALLGGEQSMQGPNEPQHIAAMYGADEISKELSKRGVMPKQNLVGIWPSSIAARYGYKKLAVDLSAGEMAVIREIMLKPSESEADDKTKKAIANSKDWHRRPMLNMFIRNKDFGMFMAFIDADAPIEGEKSLEDHINETQHVVALHGTLEMAQELFKRNVRVKPNLRNVLPSNMAQPRDHKLADAFREREQQQNAAKSLIRRGADSGMATSNVHNPRNAYNMPKRSKDKI